MQLEIHRQKPLRRSETQKRFVDFKLSKCANLLLQPLSDSLFSDVMLLLLFPSHPRLSCRSSAQHGTTGDAPLSLHFPITDLNSFDPPDLEGNNTHLKKIICNCYSYSISS